VRRDWFDSFNDAVNGLIRAVRAQRNIRLHFIFAILAVALALRLRIGPTEFVLVTVVVGLVLVAELFNSALEGVVDLVAEHYHPLAKAAKDIAAGAVLVAAGVAVTCGYLLFVPRLAGPAVETLDAAARGPEYVTALALLGTALLVVVGKAVLGKGEPLLGGMPSGHAAVSFAAATAVAFLARDFLVALLGFGLALMVAQSRLLCRVHTLREVVAGALLGVLCALLLFQFLR
jgi:diacylglycerol kinase (ATP)